MRQEEYAPQQLNMITNAMMKSGDAHIVIQNHTALQ